MKKISKLKKINDFEDGFSPRDGSNDMISLFKNPTSKEIEIAKSELGNGSVRGVIYRDGTMYCWNGNILHHLINRRLGASKSKTRIDVSSSFRFGFEGDEWTFDAHGVFTFKETMEFILKHNSTLQKFGDTSYPMSIYFTTDTIKNTMKEYCYNNFFKDNDIFVDDNCAGFLTNGLELMKLIVDAINSNTKIQNPNGEEDEEVIETIMEDENTTDENDYSDTDFDFDTNFDFEEGLYNILKNGYEGSKKNNVVKISRLKKSSDFIDGYIGTHCSDMASVFVNPTSEEIEFSMSESSIRGVRGVIYNDGTEYCWNVNTVHYLINKKLSSAKSTLNIDVENSFRFAYERGSWLIDAHDKFTLKETCEMFLKYQDKLSKYGNINDYCEFYFLRGGNLKDELCDINTGNFSFFDSDCISFNSNTIDDIKILINELENIQ